MSRSVPDRLLDILYSADLGGQHARGLSAEALAATPLARDAPLFRIAVMCEAASQLPAEVKALAAEIPWSDIRVANDLEPLKRAVNHLIAAVEADRE
jgi:uncharacterized protein with HEPN domain